MADADTTERRGDPPGDESAAALRRLVARAAPMFNDPCLAHGGAIVRLVAVHHDPEGLYYTVLTMKGEMVHYSAVVTMEGLRGRIDDYDRLDATFGINGGGPQENFTITESGGYA